MSSKEMHHLGNVDIDPGWYPGQPELLEEGGETQEQQEAMAAGEDGGASSGVAGPDGANGLDGAVPLRGNRAEPLQRLVSGPTVLTKLQKWGDYESVGEQVLPTKFIPMKTPLSAEILDSWSLPTQPKHRLTVPEMVAQQAALGRKVGLLLDLSNHDCLYTADIPPGLTYTHIQLVAKELPPPEFVDTVVAVANHFWRMHPDEYIAVHCAYGYNRTGFVVCCYLIECCGLSVEDALTAFAESRPPGVKHEQFRAELHRRYDSLEGMSATQGPQGTHGAYGSPDDNSSFGYSPSCASLDLRDLICGGGYSPAPLARGATCDCLLGPGPQTVSIAPGGNPHPVRRSLDGHQTLTFSSSSYLGVSTINARGSILDGAGGVDRGGGCLGSGGSIGGGLKPWQLQQPAQEHRREHRDEHQHDHQHPSKQAQPSPPACENGVARAGESGNDEQYAAAAAETGSVWPSQEASARTDSAKLRGRPAPAKPSAPVASRSGVASVRTAAMGAPPPKACSPARQQARSMDDREQCGSFTNENESLGLTDRMILQSLRQQATIPEEGGSPNSTPVRGCSTDSLAGSDRPATGQSTPRTFGQTPGRYSHKSLETIDWGAASAAAEEEALYHGTGGGNINGGYTG